MFLFSLLVSGLCIVYVRYERRVFSRIMGYDHLPERMGMVYIDI